MSKLIAVPRVALFGGRPDLYCDILFIMSTNTKVSMWVLFVITGLPFLVIVDTPISGFTIGLAIYLLLLVLSIFTIQKLLSLPRTTEKTHYPFYGQVWFWWIVSTIAYISLIGSYDANSSGPGVATAAMKVGSVIGFFVPVGPNSIIISLAALPVAIVLIIISDRAVKYRPKLPILKKILYVSCVLFTVTYVADLMRVLTPYGSYDIFYDSVIHNQNPNSDPYTSW
jgi:hypothetical protein